MQRKFIRYFAVIMLVTVGITLMGNFFLQTRYAQVRAKSEAYGIVTEITRRISENEKVIETLVSNLDENYITRADAFAEMIVQKPEILESFDEMDRIAALLGVSEVHVTDEKGVLRWGNVKAYYGLDFTATEQTRPFLPALTDKNFKLAQKPQPNGSEGKLFQYISVARQDKPGIVQVGVAPEVLDQALANNKIDVVISGYNVRPGVDVIVYDMASGAVVADSKKNYIGKTYEDMDLTQDYITMTRESGWLTQDGSNQFAVFRALSGYLYEMRFTRDYLFAERQNQTVASAVSSVFLGMAIMAAIFYLLKKWIIRDIDMMNRDLKQITDGRLDVIVDVHSTEEFISLSNGINEMVDSLKYQMQQIATQAENLEMQNENIMASLNYARKIQNNLLPSPQAFSDGFEDYEALWEPRDQVGGDIYWLKRFNEGNLLCVCDCTGHGTPGALLTMIVVTALDAITKEKNCTDTAEILWQLDKRLASILNASEQKNSMNVRDGADLAVLFIKNNGEIVLSSAKMHIFVCNGRTVENIRGQRLSIGEGEITGKEQIETLTIPKSPGNTYYIVSDGLFDQVGGSERIPFGYQKFRETILENHGKSQKEITEKVWEAFLLYKGNEERRDDVTMLSFKQKKGAADEGFI